MALELRIVHDAGGTTTLSAEQGASKTRDLDEQARAEATVYRDDWTGVSLDERNDELYLDVDGTTEFGGRFDDERAGDGTVSVRIASFETDAADAEPTGDNLVYQNVADSTIVTDAIASVSGLSPGSVTTQANAISYSASHASQSKVIRDQREATGSEVRYNADKTVDYVDRLGADKSASVTVGPAEGNLGGQFRKTVDAREEVTHVKALGAQEGPDQVTATAIAPSYDGGRPVWKRYSNKEVVDESRLQAIADELVAEYDGEPRSLEVECAIFDENLVLGDTVTVDYPEEGVQRALRIVTLVDEWTGRGSQQRVTLSNRALARGKTDAKRHDDLERFNRGYQGFVDRDQVTSGWNPAGDGTAQTLEIVNWPDDVVTEQTVELTVQGREWRSPVTPESHSHSFSVSSHSHEVTLDDHAHGITYIATGGHSHEAAEAFADGSGHSHPISRFPVTDDEQATTTSDSGGGTTKTTSSGGSTSSTTGSTVPLSPSISTTFGGNTFYPSDVEIRVEGTLVDTIAGDSTATWQATIDLAGQLSPGQNTIQALPTTTRGSVNLSLASELFRRGPTS